MTTQQTELKAEAQLPPKFQPHPENAAIVLTIDRVIFMVKRKMLTLEGAYYVLPPYLWPFLPKETPKPQRTKPQPKRRGWLSRLFWRLR